MKATAAFEIELPDIFTIQKMQEFDFADEEITYKNIGECYDGTTVYEKTVKNGLTSVISAQEAANDYFLASLCNNPTMTSLKEC